MCLAFITHNLPDSDETKDVLKIFRLFNENDDGKLTKAELHAGLVKYYDAKEIKGKIDDIFLILDGANRGFVEYEEFLRACMSKEKLLSEENLIYAFNFFDKDNTGKISIAKIKNIFVGSKVNEAVFKSIINEVDQNQDGEIDYQEFKDMMFGY
jgi:calcium-dependent protein kinase